MSTTYTFKFALALLVSTLACACDRRPPTAADRDRSKEQPDTASEQSRTPADKKRNSAARGESTTPAGDRPNWKANDVHTHVGPDAYPVVAKILENEEIFRIANMSGGNDPEQFNRHTDPPAALANRIAPFYTPEWSNADEPDFAQNQAERLERAVREGYAGLKISKALGLEVENAQGELIDVDSPKLDPLWEQAGELSVPVLIHTADPKAFFEEPGPENERWEELQEAPDWSFHGEEYPSRKSLLEARDRMVTRHDDTTFILAHMGNNPEDMDYVRDLLERHDHLYVDTAARIAEFGRHPASQIRQFFIDFQERILFGSDLGVHARSRGGELYYSLFLGSISKEPPSLEDIGPFFDKHWRYFETDKQAVDHPIPIQGNWKVHPIDLPSRVLDKVFRTNAERLVFAPWIGRRAAHRTARRARQLTDRTPR